MALVTNMATADGGLRLQTVVYFSAFLLKWLISQPNPFFFFLVIRNILIGKELGIASYSTFSALNFIILMKAIKAAARMRSRFIRTDEIRFIATQRAWTFSELLLQFTSEGFASCSWRVIFTLFVFLRKITLVFILLVVSATFPLASVLLNSWWQHNIW